MLCFLIAEKKSKSYFYKINIFGFLPKSFGETSNSYYSYSDSFNSNGKLKVSLSNQPQA